VCRFKETLDRNKRKRQNTDRNIHDIEKEIERWRDRGTERQTDRQAHRQTDRETVTKVDRETEIRERERDINTQNEKKQSDTATYCLKRISASERLRNRNKERNRRDKEN
jgi:hypothetical protein